jgi:DNA repair exonuclease SbcCD ATPase subunit
MADQNSAIDVYYDMDIAQICQHFNKSRNTVDKAVAKLVKNYPDKGWKFKNPETRRVTIKAAGVEVLSTYFRKEKQEISTVEAELRAENEKLQAILLEKEKSIAAMENMYLERLKVELDKNHQTFLLEQKSKDDHIKEQNDLIDNQKETIDKQDGEISELKTENQKLKEDAERMTALEKELEDIKRKEEEYNSKSLFYRMFHKFSSQ